MKKKILYSVIALLVLIHFLFLHFLGISSYTTTLLFYFLVYQLFKLITSFIKNAELQKTIRMNIKVFLGLLLFFEFLSTFVFKRHNDYMENQMGVYFSPYMHKAQVRILYSLGITKNNKNAWEDGYGAFYRHQHKTKDFLYEVTYNALGLRGPLPPVKKDSSEFRIVVLGDSFAEGYGTNEDSTFPKLLENNLRKYRDHITVINGGICGSNPKSEILLYYHLLDQYKPDLVILETNESDVEDYYVALRDGKMPFDEYGYAMCHMLRIWDNATSTDDSDLINKKITTVKTMIQQLNNFKTDLAERDQKFMVVSLSLQSQLYGETGFLDFMLCASDLPVIDLKKCYGGGKPIQQGSFKKYYWKYDGHHTPLGYSLMAKTVAHQLIERNYVRIH